jgi:hypothetical protein
MVNHGVLHGVSHGESGGVSRVYHLLRSFLWRGHPTIMLGETSQGTAS